MVSADTANISDFGRIHQSRLVSLEERIGKHPLLPFEQISVTHVTFEPDNDAGNQGLM
jgi:hypothetical protein